MARFYATFPSLSIHFAGCYDLAKFWIWPFSTFKTYILIIKSQQKYSNFVYFGIYLRIFVSIGTSAKFRSYTVMLLKADILFFKTKVNIHLICSVLSFYAVFAFQNSLYGVQKPKGKHVFRKIEIIHVRHIVSSIAQKRNSVNFRNSSCKLAMLSKLSYQKSRIASPRIIRIFKN